MGLFDDLDQAEMFENSKHFAEGRYIVRLEACKFKQGGYRGDTFIVETTVLAVVARDGNVKQRDQTQLWVEYPRPGERAAHVWGASGDAQKIKQGRGEWMSFMCAAFACKKNTYDGLGWKSISAQLIDNNYLKGQLLALDCHMKRTGVDGPFTVHNWRGIATLEQLASFGLAADGSVVGTPPGHEATAPPPVQEVAAPPPAPQYAKDAAGLDIVSHDNRVTWAHVV